MGGTAHEFSYLSFTDGRAGYLLDLIRRPRETMARLAVYRQGAPPRVLRQAHPLEAWRADDQGVTLGPWRLDERSCSGTVDGVAVACELETVSPEVRLVPALVARVFKAVPAFCSTPARVVRGTAGPDTFTGLPCVLSRYTVNDLAAARWFLVSLQEPEMRCELAAGWVLGRWAVSGYLWVDGTRHELTHPLRDVPRFRVVAGGSLGGGGSDRRFAVSYRSKRLSLDIAAHAPVGEFALLDREGETAIWTTLLGTCRVRAAPAGQATRELTSTGRCLLEVKEPVTAA